MKSIFFSAILVCGLLFCVAHFSDATITCGVVDMSAAACVKFAQGKDQTPSPACCNGLQRLAQSVKSVNDKKDICRCLKAGVKNFPGVQDRFLSKIPASCKITVSFPVSINTNCDTIH